MADIHLIRSILGPQAARPGLHLSNLYIFAVYFFNVPFCNIPLFNREPGL